VHEVNEMARGGGREKNGEEPGRACCLSCLPPVHVAHSMESAIQAANQECQRYAHRREQEITMRFEGRSHVHSSCVCGELCE